ncbi:hypothetical protein F3Y22_tig00110893pilonHSYRG00904 [Hibiscus syriacus]|uniref:Probable magnesium transporter n=1 Tax=Hibiscus syriacus TaxID=106335 RepID=A0A6A2ZH16_HIBSY|nr:hypothetical protein F3Y22_tig00110893pilonHSYRG00904 [Hibiscus syriacus]
MFTMIVGGVANFVEYAFAPAILVTPLGDMNYGYTTSFFTVSGLSYCIGHPFDLIFSTEMWANKCVGFPRHLFLDGISLGMSFQLWIIWYIVMSVKALGTALKLTFEGRNQLVYPETWFFVFIVATCVITQMNYLNKALNTFNTAVVSHIYYVMFTSLTILASVIMFKIETVKTREASYLNCVASLLCYVGDMFKKNTQQVWVEHGSLGEI